MSKKTTTAAAVKASTNSATVAARVVGGQEIIKAVNGAMSSFIPEEDEDFRVLRSLLGNKYVDVAMAMGFKMLVSTQKPDSPSFNLGADMAMDAAMVRVFQGFSTEGLFDAVGNVIDKVASGEVNNTASVPEEKKYKVHGVPEDKPESVKEEPPFEEETPEDKEEVFDPNRCRVCGEVKKRKQLNKVYNIPKKLQGLIEEYDEYNGQKNICPACIKILNDDLEEARKDAAASAKAEKEEAEYNKADAEKLSREMEHWENKIKQLTVTYDQVKEEIKNLLLGGKSFKDLPEGGEKAFPEEGSQIWDTLFGRRATEGYERTKTLNIYAASIKDAEDTLALLLAGGEHDRLAEAVPAKELKNKLYKSLDNKKQKLPFPDKKVEQSAPSAKVIEKAPAKGTEKNNKVKSQTNRRRKKKGKK